MLENVTGLVGALLAIVLVLALAYVFTRYVVGRAPTGVRPGRRMTVLEQMNLGRDQKLLLVQVGDSVYLLGVAQGSVTYLRTIPKAQVDQWKQDAEGGAGAENPSFGAALQTVLRQRRK